MKSQLAVASEFPETPWANEREESWQFLIGERWTKADVRPELAPSEASNIAVGTIVPQVADVAMVTSDPLPGQGVGTRIIQPVEFRKPKYHQNRGAFTTLQRWEGNVIEIGAETFTARLSDKTAARADEDGEFSLEEVSPADRALLQPGAVFYWSVGYLDHRNGQRTRESLIRFRRLPAWNKRELVEARQRAQKALEEIDSFAGPLAT